jgi:hypothetical protein
MANPACPVNIKANDIYPLPLAPQGIQVFVSLKRIEWTFFKGFGQKLEAPL